MRRLALALALLLAPASARADWPDELGPYWIGNDDARVRPSLFLQLRLDVEGGDDQTVTWTPRIRRVRPMLRGSFLGGRITSNLHLEVTPTSPELIDAWIDGRFTPWLRLRVGQMKSPFTQYYQRSLIELSNDWPLTSYWFGGERQLGLMAHGRHTESGVSYALALTAGQNRRGAFARNLARAYGERLENPSSLTDPAPSEAPHPEIVARIGHSHEDARPDRGVDLVGSDVLRHAVAFSVSWDARPTARRDFALRLAPELRLEIAGFSLDLIGYAGFFEPAEGGVALGALGAHGELAWHAHRHLDLVVRYSRVHLLPALLEDARAYGPGASPANCEHEAAFGVNVLVIGRSLAWMTDVAWLRADVQGDPRDDVRLRTQLQLAF